MLIFSQDTDGDEDFMLYKLDLSNIRNSQPDLISAQPGVQAVFMAVSNQQRNKLIFGANDEYPT